MDNKDIRYNNFHIINKTNTDKFSKNWEDFPGLHYIPFSTELENWVINTIDVTYLQELMLTKWHWSFYISIFYMILIPVLKKWMEIRGQRYNLRTLLVIWNSILAVFSVVGVVRCLPEFYHIFSTKGFTSSFCESDYYMDLRVNIWYLMFVWSKVIELIDTLFIILRNGKLLTLHWVHHCLTLCYSWYVFGDVPATARWMVNMNFIAHSFMYTYYALKALRISIPLVISISITSIQILQMIFGLYINYKVIEFKRSGIACDASLSVAVTGLSLYTLFFVLFANFFVNSYLRRPKTFVHKNNITKSISDRNNNINRSKVD